MKGKGVAAAVNAPTNKRCRIFVSLVPSPLPSSHCIQYSVPSPLSPLLLRPLWNSELLRHFHLNPAPPHGVACSRYYLVIGAISFRGFDRLLSPKYELSWWFLFWGKKRSNLSSVGLGIASACKLHLDFLSVLRSESEDFVWLVGFDAGLLVS
jgi:hypothetical protein